MITAKEARDAMPEKDVASAEDAIHNVERAVKTAASLNKSATEVYVPEKYLVEILQTLWDNSFRALAVGVRDGGLNGIREIRISVSW